jgi:D-lactate dehydrogenase (cytochrome)
MPDVKSAAGYWVRPDMELIDLIIGAEGSLGIVTQMDLRLLPAPAYRWGFTAFLKNEENALCYVRSLRGEKVRGVDVKGEVRPTAIEFFNSGALDLLRRQKAENPAFSYLPQMPEEYHTAVYVEYHGDDEDAVSDAIMRAAEIVVACGGDEDATWSAMEPQGIERLRKFRHATPEAVNLTIDQRRRDEPKLTKLGTDMAVPDAHLEAVMAMYRDSLAASGLESVIFGHIGNNHVHVNIIPRNLEEYAKGKELYMEWARKIIAMGGTVSAEHGIGKLKADFLKAMYGEKGIAQMRAVKKVFDPQGLLNPGTLFPVA